MPYENISGLIDLNAEPKLKIAIVGVPKVGKSWFAYTAPPPIWSFDLDTRSESLKEFCKKFNRTDIEGKTYYDSNPATPNAMQQMETDIAMFEYLKQQGKPIPTTFILDSATYMRIAMEHELIKQQPTFCRTVKIGTTIVKIPTGWDVINGVKDYTAHIISKLAELGNVVCIFHEADEPDRPKSTKEQKAYTGMKTIHPPYLSSALSLFDHVFRMTLDYTGERVVQCQPNNEFMACTSFKLAPEEKPDIMAMLAKHKA